MKSTSKQTFNFQLVWKTPNHAKVTRILLVTFLLFIIFKIAHAQTEKKHPIDIQREACHNAGANQTTTGMTNCEHIAADEWDRQLNEYYNTLMKLLKSEERAALKNAQQHWIKFRDQELGFYGQLYNNRDGTMWRIVAANRRMEIIKTRALELEEYINNIKSIEE